MVADLDLRFQTAIADDLPSAPRQPDQRASRRARRDRRRPRRGARRRRRRRRQAGGAEADGGHRPAGARPGARLHRHPAVVQHPGGEPLSIAATCAGKVVLIDFWTYTCINCIRTLPYVEAWDAQLPRRRADDRRRPHARVPVREGRRQRRATRSPTTGITYPVVQDNDYGTWNAYGNQYWPAKYLIDADGNVRYVHFGEGDYDETEQAIRSLLRRGRATTTSAAGRERERRARRPGA